MKPGATRATRVLMNEDRRARKLARSDEGHAGRVRWREVGALEEQLNAAAPFLPRSSRRAKVAAWKILDIYGKELWVLTTGRPCVRVGYRRACGQRRLTCATARPNLAQANLYEERGGKACATRTCATLTLYIAPT